MLLKCIQRCSIIAVLLVTGCQNLSSQSLPSSQLTETKDASTLLESTEIYILTVPILDVTKTPTIEPTSTLEIKNNISFTNMQSGQYILININDQYGNYHLYVFTTNGKVEQKILVDNADWSTSSDGKQIYYLLSSWANAAQNTKLQQAKIFDVSSNKWEDVNVNIIVDCRRFVQSPNAQMIVFDCFDGSTPELYLLKKNSDLLEKITDCRENHEMCSSIPGWSFDGKWFIYYREDAPRSGYHPDVFNGAYIFNTECFNDNSCINKQIGPTLYTQLFWSNDNKIIDYANKSLRFHEFKDGVILSSNKVTKINVQDNIVGRFYPSPDGQYFVYAHTNNENTETTMSMFSLSSNTSQELMKVSYSYNIVGWIVVP